MPRLRRPDCELEYRVLEPTSEGATAGNAVLIHGLGCQLIQWPPPVLDALRGAGLRLLIFDNRDAGLSTLNTKPVAIRHSGVDLLRWRLGARLPAAYGLADMAADTLALMDTAGMDCAHVIGVSMGGMIAQELALTAPERTTSLSVIMSTSGRRSVGYARREVMQALMTPPPAREPEAVIRHLTAQWCMLQGTDYPTPETEIAERVAACVERGLNPVGFRRQFQAILNAANREPRLRRLNVSTLVLHGRDDPLVHVSGGEAVARAIPNAATEFIDGWGHDFPTALLPRLTSRLVEHIQAVS